MRGLGRKVKRHAKGVGKRLGTIVWGLYGILKKETHREAVGHPTIGGHGDGRSGLRLKIASTP